MGEGWHSECYEDETMVEGIYNNAASLSVLEKWQATISQNLASSNVAGFKKANFAIQSDERKKTEYEPDGVSAARHTGGVPTRTTSINFSPGDLKALQRAAIARLQAGACLIKGDADGPLLHLNRLEERA